jgi:hypothetical protein
MEAKMATKQVKQQGPSAGVPKTDVGERGAMQIIKTLDSMIAALEEALEEMRDSKPNLARRKKCARILTEGIAALEKHVNGETIFFWRDEKGELFDDTDDGTAEGYLEIHQQRGDDHTTITLSPKEVKELRPALEADLPVRPARRKHARNLKRRAWARQPVKKNAAN